jgi:hypothetical protein
VMEKRNEAVNPAVDHIPGSDRVRHHPDDDHDRKNEAEDSQHDALRLLLQKSFGRPPTAAYAERTFPERSGSTRVIAREIVHRNEPQLQPRVYYL